MLVVCIRMYPYVPYVTRMLLVCYPYVLVWCFSHDLKKIQLIHLTSKLIVKSERGTINLSLLVFFLGGGGNTA